MRRQLALIAFYLLAALFFFLLCVGAPFAWLLRDGLGPDSTTSSNWDAVVRCLKTFYIGPALAVTGVLTAVAWVASRGKKGGAVIEDGGDRW